MGELAMRAAFKQVDKNNNGKIDYKEVMSLMNMLSTLVKTNSGAAQ
jgi:hypothetical protein